MYQKQGNNHFNGNGSAFNGNGSAPDRRHFQIAIAGAGFSGLGMAMALKRSGFEDFVIFERADDLGGTWRDNTYPGCACDIPSVLYSWSTEQNPRWSQAFAGQQEIWDYMREVVEKHDLERYIRYRTEVRSMRWDAEQNLWEAETSQGTFTAEIAIAAVGGLADPAIPTLPGLERFKGRSFHSARWDHDFDLNQSEVAVVGTGASAIQFVPEIQPKVRRLHLFQRTPPWVMPRANPPIPKGWRKNFTKHPRLLHAARTAVFSLFESFHAMFTHPRLSRLTERRAKRHIASQVKDPELREKVTPNYRVGCKRILGSNDWYPALCADNVEVVSCGIREVTERGIVDQDGIEHRVDAIIFGTGFQVTDPPVSHRVAGPDGRKLAEHWSGSPKAHLGLSVAGFPNFFMLLGPNTGLGHNSVLLMVEAQIKYLIQLLSDRRTRGYATIEPHPQAQAKWVNEVEEGTRGSVWTSGGCVSWYLDATGRNSTLWPGTVRAYQRRMKRFDPGDYRISSPARPRKTPAPVPAAAQAA
jgi:cation diffusion facilitator CzcD-associated flavoprotein CzcO